MNVPFSFDWIQAGNQTLNGRESVLQILRVFPRWGHGRSSDRRVCGGDQHVIDVARGWGHCGHLLKFPNELSILIYNMPVGLKIMYIHTRTGLDELRTTIVVGENRAPVTIPRRPGQWESCLRLEVEVYTHDRR